MARGEYTFPNPTTVIGNKIKRRRLQVLIHSCLYYDMDTIIVEDHIFDKWCTELAGLLKQYPDEYSDRFDDHFKNWNGESGHQMPHRDPWVFGTAKMLLNIHEKRIEKENESTLEDFFV